MVYACTDIIINLKGNNTKKITVGTVYSFQQIWLFFGYLFPLMKVKVHYLYYMHLIYNIQYIAKVMCSGVSLYLLTNNN